MKEWVNEVTLSRFELKNFFKYADSGKKPEVPWKRGLRALILKMAT